MKLLRFRIGGTFTGTYAVGPNAYTVGQEFTLREDQARRWISQADIQGGYVIPLGEAGGEQGQYMDSQSASYLAGKDGDIGGVPQDTDRFSITLNPTFVYTGATGIAKYRPDCECVFLGVEFPQVSATGLVSAGYNIDLRRYKNGLTDGGSLLESFIANETGPTVTPVTGCLFYDASAGTYTDYTTAAKNITANDVILSSMQTTDYLYVGWYAPFDGFSISGGAFNGTTAVATIKYPSVDADGVTTWTALTANDGSTSGGATIGQAGAITWELVPGDWKRMAITSGGTQAYWVRFSTDAAFDSSTTLTQIKIITRLLPGYDNDDLILYKGDVLCVNSPVAITTTTTNATATIILHFARVR